LNVFFGRINQYFDGKCTDDEILFRAEIPRSQLREVLHMYDEYVGITPLTSLVNIADSRAHTVTDILASVMTNVWSTIGKSPS
jgi:hypothetical protein